MNDSGIRPVNCNVLIKADVVAEKIGSVFVPEQKQEQNQHAQTQGMIVALCEDAFHEMKHRPQAGDRVCFARYAGSEVTGVDDAKYRLLKDIDVTGVMA